MAYTQLIPQSTPSARVEQISEDSSHHLLSITSGKANEYRLAQLSDYALLSRGKFPHTSLTLKLSARVSSNNIPGTWGFGLWNDPFGMSIGFGGKPFRLPALPNAIWFFGASEENYLSFRNLDREDPAPASPANGFLAQSFRSPKFHPLLVLTGLTLPFSRKLTRRLMSQVIAEDGVQLWNRGAGSRGRHQQADRVQSVDPTDWHRYRLEWSQKHVLFEVDDVPVFESAVSPNPPLGLVIWIDNQYAAFTPKGKIGFGVLDNPEPAWLEIKELEFS